MEWVDDSVRFLLYTYLLYIIMVGMYKIERWNEFNITSGDITTWGNKEIHELIIQFENAFTSEQKMKKRKKYWVFPHIRCVQSFFISNYFMIEENDFDLICFLYIFLDILFFILPFNFFFIFNSNVNRKKNIQIQ